MTRHLSESGGDRLLLESLEQRVFLSVSVDPTGLMVVTGSSGADAIVVRSGGDAGSVKVKGDPDEDDRVYTGITQLFIVGGAGDDRIRIKGALFADDGWEMPVTVYGGEGDDHIRGGRAGRCSRATTATIVFWVDRVTTRCTGDRATT